MPGLHLDLDFISRIQVDVDIRTIQFQQACPCQITRIFEVTGGTSLVTLMLRFELNSDSIILITFENYAVHDESPEPSDGVRF